MSHLFSDARPAARAARATRLRGLLAKTLLVGAATTLARQALLLYGALQRGRSIARAAQPFEVSPARPRARVLMLGDSTGVGVGCLHAGQTMAGLLAAEFPRVEIVNLCRNGARLADTVAQCEPHAARGDAFDLVLMFAGGNDVIRLASKNRMIGDARALLAQVQRLSENVVWMGSANIGGSPVLIPPLSWWMAWRTRHAMGLLASEAHACGVAFIDFVKVDSGGIFARHHEVYFAEDGLHPAPPAYRFCYAVLKSRVPLQALLARSPGLCET